jgi:hemerythrin
MPHANSLSYATGLPDVDHAWPELKRSILHLITSVSYFLDRVDIENAFDDVIERALPLFRMEEEAMEMLHDPYSLAHRTGHKKFLENLQIALRQFREEGPSFALVDFLRTEIRDWLFDHERLLHSRLSRRVEIMVEPFGSFS